MRDYRAGKQRREAREVRSLLSCARLSRLALSLHERMQCLALDHVVFILNTVLPLNVLALDLFFNVFRPSAGIDANLVAQSSKFRRGTFASPRKGVVLRDPSRGTKRWCYQRSAYLIDKLEQLKFETTSLASVTFVSRSDF